jgi:hypothetical protein
MKTKSGLEKQMIHAELQKISFTSSAIRQNAISLVRIAL